MTQLVFNSFPRSANVYLGHTAPRVIDTMCSTVHMPEIFIVQDLPMVAVFRKPEDAIASLVNKQLERSGANPVVSNNSVAASSQSAAELYRKYLTSAANNHKNLYIAKFDDITTDTLSHLIKISETFDLPTTKDYDQAFSSIVLEGPLWSNSHDGHLPREKNETRTRIEKIVSELDFIKELNKEYYDFIETYAS